MTLQQLANVIAHIQQCGVAFTIRELQVLLVSPAPAAPQAVSVRDIACALGINKPSVSRAVAMLVQHGLLTRIDNETNRRQVVIHRTKAGDSLLTRAIAQ